MKLLSTICVALGASLATGAFSALGARPQPSGASQSPWVRYTDRSEYAFTIDVPRGWHVAGGIFRRSPIQPHVVLLLESPEGRTELLLGNVEGYAYAALSPLGRQLGFHEEMAYAPGVDRLWVRNYRPGRVFAEVYGRHVLAAECANVKLLGSRERPEGDSQTVSYGVPQMSTAGEAFFTCERGGHSFEAYIYSRTDSMGTPQTALQWNADHTGGFVTPKGNGMAAGVVLAHIAGSLRFDQRWLATQLRVSQAAVAKTLAAANQQLDVQREAMERTFAASSPGSGATQAEQSQDEMERLISGFDEYQTSTGERKTVQYGATANWWSNSRGATLGTQSSTSPGSNWTPMSRVPLGR